MPYFSIGLGGQYIQKGTEESFLGATAKIKLDYFELMLPLVFTIPIENSPLRPRLYAGPAIAFEASCKISAEVSGVSADADCNALSDITGDSDDDIETESTDYGVFFGAGADFAVGSGAITLDILYNLGLANLDKAGKDLSPEESAKNRTFQILAGYRFFFGS